MQDKSIEKRTEEILSVIEEIAPFYVPDWRFDGGSKDAGVALAKIFARQLSESDERFERMPHNQRISLFNRLGAKRLPATPASGILCFVLNENAPDGVLIKKDFKLFSPLTDDVGTRYSFETDEDIYVTTADIVELVYFDYENDFFSFWEDKDKPFKMWENNRQSHTLTINHEYIDNADSKSRLYLTLNSSNAPLWLERLSSPAARWEFCRLGKSYELIPVLSEGCICFSGIPELSADNEGDESSEDVVRSQIRLKVLDITPFRELSAPEILLKAWGNGYLPSEIFLNGEQETDYKFYPFGKEFSPQNEVTFLSDNIFSRKGAVINIKFTVGFDVIETDDLFIQTPPQKSIIFKKDIKPPKKSDILITKVVWEYFNGLGFVPLKLNGFLDDAFTGLDDLSEVRKEREINASFICPSDIEPMLAGSQMGYSIRCRIKSILNPHKRPAVIYTPWMGGVVFGFNAPPLTVTDGIILNSGEEKTIFPLPNLLFYSSEEQTTGIHFGFNFPPIGGLIHLLVLCHSDGEEIPVNWYYWDKSGRRNLNVEDRTFSFTQMGLISFILDSEPVFSEKFGKKAFWITASFKHTPPSFYIEKIYLNAIPVTQRTTVKEERHYLEKRNKSIQLKSKNIIEEKLLISQKSSDKEEEWRPLFKKEYNIDRAEGVITLTTSFDGETSGFILKADYRYGGGKDGNFSRGQYFIPALNIGYVSHAFNPLSILGGADAEKSPDAAKRLSKSLRHNNIPLTAKDFSELIASPEIAAINANTAKGGKVEITILIKNYKSSFAFTQIKERVLKKILPLLPPELGGVEILPPLFVKVSVNAEVRVSRKDELSKCLESLSELLDPISYTKTYGFGSFPDIELIKNTVTEEVAACHRLYVRYSIGINEIETPPPFALPLNGVHSIISR